MLSKKEFDAVLSEKGTLIIDGALATELEVRGHDLKHPLWSGIVLRDSPESIKSVHLDYFLAGADVAITASYQSATQGLLEHFGMDELQAMALIKQSAELAQQARDQAYSQGVQRKLLVAGSVGPYGAYLSDGSEYRGDYIRSKTEFQDFHRPRIRALVEAGVDLLAVETMPKIEEIQAVLELVRNEFPSTTAWLGCTLKDDHHLSDGTTLEDLMNLVNAYREQVLAVGINCVPIDLVTSTLQHVRRFTDLPLLCYPNSGEVWDAKNHQWLSKSTIACRTTALAKEWQAEGAKLIGGCCRTGPAFVTDISIALKTH